METVYQICAAVGGTLIVCQFLLTLVGLGNSHDIGGHDVGDHDMGGHDVGSHDTDGQHEAEHDAQPSWLFSVLTFRALAAALAFFGLAGLACRRFALETEPTLVVALAAGGLALVVVAWVMKFMSRLNVDGTVHIGRAVGARGTVYLSVPGARSGAGKVLVNVLHRTVEYKAITSQEQLPTGAKIVVVGVVSGDTVEVAPATELERTAHASA